MDRLRQTCARRLRYSEAWHLIEAVSLGIRLQFHKATCRQRSDQQYQVPQRLYRFLRFSLLHSNNTSVSHTHTHTHTPRHMPSMYCMSQSRRRFKITNDDRNIWQATEGTALAVMWISFLPHNYIQMNQFIVNTDQIIHSPFCTYHQIYTLTL